MSAAKTPHLYFVISRRAGELEVAQFESAADALDTLEQIERSLGSKDEVVLFLAKDIGELRATHSGYFRSVTETPLVDLQYRATA